MSNNVCQPKRNLADPSILDRRIVIEDNLMTDQQETCQTPLRSLLSQCRENDLHNGILSLRQLVPVHRTLCQCALSTQKCHLSSLSGASPSNSLSPILELRCQGEDRALCEKILLFTPSSSDTERLLVIQYLLHPLSLRESIQHVLIPYLLSSSMRDPASWEPTEDPDENEDCCAISPDFQIALLDLVQGDLGDIDGADSQWRNLVTTLAAASTSNPAAGRLLVRLIRLQPTSSIMISGLYQAIWETTQTALKVPPVLHQNQNAFQNHPILSTISKDFLPLFLLKQGDGTNAINSHLHQEHRHELVCRLIALWSNASSASRDQQRVTMLVITTVLCPLMPHLVHDTSIPLHGSDEDVMARPIDQPLVWDLIRTCLAQGTSVLEDGPALSSILRRRGLFLLNTLVHEDDNSTTSASPPTVKHKEWKQYVLCYETLEMEHEQHLVDQIWSSVGELFDMVSDGTPSAYGVLTWEWMSLLLGCVLSSPLPVIRKMGMYRLLKAQEGNVAIDQQPHARNKKKWDPSKPRRKQKAAPIKTSVTSILERMPPNFVLQILLPSWNSLAKTVGYNMHIQLQNRKLDRQDMIPMMHRVLKSYLRGLSGDDTDRALTFWKGLWEWSLMQHFTTTTVVSVFQSLAEELVAGSTSIPMDNEGLQSLAAMIQSCFEGQSVVLTHRREILQAVSTMLAHTRSVGHSRSSPLAILYLLAQFGKEYFALDSEDWSLDQEPILVNLQTWVEQFESQDGQANTSSTGSAITATLATAFVDGQLGGQSKSRAWDPEYGATANECELAWAVVLLSSLTTAAASTTSSQLLWPAIHKGLSSTAGAVMTSTHLKADHVTRALLLLEDGCLLRQLSGLGNGDLVLDQKTQQIMPPPPNIEMMLSSAVDFILFHIRTLLSIESNEAANGAKHTSNTYIRLVTRLRTLYQAYPSSEALSSAMEALLKASYECLNEGCDSDNQRVMHANLVYAALSSGADLGKDSYMPMARLLVGLDLSGDTREKSNTWEHMARAVLFYAKWASVSRILPSIAKAIGDASNAYLTEAHEFIEWILAQAFDAVNAAAQDSVVPVFNTILEAAKLWVVGAKVSRAKGEEFYIDTLDQIIRALLDLMKGATLSYEGVYMLNELCSLVFQPRLMREEYDRFSQNRNARTPIRDGFRNLIKLAGTERSHINRSVLCRVTVGWLGEDQSDISSLGLSAIPYCEDIVELLVHKEVKKTESATNQSRAQISGGMEIPVQTSKLSLSRAFVLVFFSKLPAPSDGLNSIVMEELLEPIILSLLTKGDSTGNAKKLSLMMIGTPAYCIKIRAWQALCNLCRFVSPKIAPEVCNETFRCIEQTIHGQIRYFVENFAIKCATLHPEVFGNTFVNDISRTDLALQQVASLMILGGNWIVGRNQLDYFQPTSRQNTIRLRRVLAAVIPWLSSTQGFSRAIAQLLVYAVTPKVIDVQIPIPSLEDESFLTGDSDWVLRLVFHFLDENKAMVKLRSKQSKFFASYDVDDVCTPEGVLGIPVDEGDEADPVNLVDAMKQTLVDVYEASHGADAPDWKQVAELSNQGPPVTAAIAAASTDDMVNFQRKIIPLDALNLAMESQREIKLSNAVGQRKQHLIVCASLIDKVPNLAGLARTAEIFAADRLIVPDKEVCRMDNFKNISVGAGEWIDIDQVRPENLLEWLLEHKAKGYFVVGLEQTASSVGLDQIVFPDRPTVLLLGMEKEGIPVELLQAVDQCVEIPQMGIIRSLNVHVSGAIAIWEHTKQRRLASSKLPKL